MLDVFKMRFEKVFGFSIWVQFLSFYTVTKSTFIFTLIVADGKEFVQRCLMKKPWRKIEENLILFVDSSGYLRNQYPSLR